MANDDGINAGGGANNSTNNNQKNPMLSADTNCILTINGGNVYVNASGDGIDSNGYIYFNGGTIIVDGPTNNGNGALDSGVAIIQNGGVVIAVGASGMAEALGSESTINSTSIYFKSNQKAGTTITIKNSSGEEIIKHTSAKSFSHMSVGTTDFKSGETYTIFINDEEYESFTISDIVTIVGDTINFDNIKPPYEGMKRWY